MQYRATAAAVAIVIASGAAPSAGDGILITHTMTDGRETLTHVAQIERTRIRTELVGSAGDHETIVYDRAAGLLRVMNDAAKTYSEISSTEIDRVGGHMAAALRDLKQQAKNAPPEERARIEAMIREMTRSPIDYAKAGAGKVGAWTCDWFDVMLKGQKVADVCVAQPVALGFTPQDLEIIKPFTEFLSQVMKGGDALLFHAGLAAPPGSNGIAVRMTGAGDAAQSRTDLTIATRQTFSEALFAVPAGYQKLPYPELRDAK